MEIGALDGRKASEKLIARCTLDRFSGGGRGVTFFGYSLFFSPHDTIFLLQRQRWWQRENHIQRGIIFYSVILAQHRVVFFDSNEFPPFPSVYFLFSLETTRIFSHLLPPRYFSSFLYREFFPPPAGSRNAQEEWSGERGTNLPIYVSGLEYSRAFRGLMLSWWQVTELCYATTGE